MPSTGTWASLVPGPGQSGYDATLATAVAAYDRFHEAIGIYANGLAGNLNVTTDTAIRAKVADLLAKPWLDTDADPTDDLSQYEGVTPTDYVTYWGMATGMYAGAEMAADAFRYGVLRDRGGSCNDVARARKVVEKAIDAFHVVVSIPGAPGSIARGIARSDLPGDGKIPTQAILVNGQPNPAEKNNGTWRADNSTAKTFSAFTWQDSCSRDMLFGWTLGIAAVWEVVAKDPTVSTALKTQLQADAKAVLGGLMTVRPNGHDLEIWDPEGRRTLNGNMDENSVDRDYIIKNGVASMMALGEVAGLVSVVGDAPSNAYLTTLETTRGLPQATTQTLSVIALGGDSTNYSSYNMVFMTAWMAHRYANDASVRTTLRSPVESGLYAPLFGLRPVDWKQSLFDFVVAASSGDAWSGGDAASTYDHTAITRGLDSLKAFPAAPFYANARTNCDAGEIAAQSCLMDDGVTVLSVKMKDGDVIANTAVPMGLRPPSNYFWRTNPFLVNAAGDPTAVFPGSDLRLAYWMGRYVRVK